MKNNENENETMNIKVALDALEISLDDIDISDLTSDFIKRKYHKLALLWHPDKNKNSIYAKEKFQHINQAYEYLCKEMPDTDLDKETKCKEKEEKKESNMMSEDKKKYVYFLSMFISSLIIGDYSELIKRAINEIVNGCGKISIKMFEELDKENALEVYSFLCKHRNTLHLSSSTLELVASAIKEKYKNDQVFVLNPTLKDLFENNLYKLWVDGKLYLVPLWHNELYFDGPNGSDIIVICNPELSKEISIDENNNVMVDFKMHAKEISDLILNDGIIVVSLGIDDKILKIPVRELKMKKEQIYKVRNEGISKICEKDIYNVSVKSDIIVRIILQ